ncbi:uncharacterized protein LOC141885620 isoform X2 [Acropora palmata]|uniref:uncharacterized protein LOC141885620 isoform X2 n=1 Tax=Acropora palmata TaxID=6131 RepID=UPI003DA169AD
MSWMLKMENKCISNLNKTKTKGKKAFIALLEANIYSRVTISVKQLFTFWAKCTRNKGHGGQLKTIFPEIFLISYQGPDFRLTGRLRQNVDLTPFVCIGQPSLFGGQFSKMTVGSDKDEQHKGQELWKALKKDPLDRRRIRDLIINGAPTNFREPGKEAKRTPLHYVIDQRDVDEGLIDVLLKHEAGTNLVDSFKMTPLHLAAVKGNLQAVKKLVENVSCPAELTLQNKNGETALEIAQRKEHRGVVSYLSKPSTGKISTKGGGGAGAGVFKQGKGSKTEAACDEIIAGGQRLSLGGPHSTSGGHPWNSCCSMRCCII